MKLKAVVFGAGFGGLEKAANNLHLTKEKASVMLSLGMAELDRLM